MEGMERLEIIEIKNLSSMRCQLDIGMVNGKTQTKMKTFTFLRNEASGADTYEVAAAIMGLQNHILMSVSKQDNTDLAL